MPKYLSIFLSVLLLAVVIIGTSIWIGAFNRSIQNYRSPLQNAELTGQSALLPQMAQVVVVLVSGLGYDSAQTLNLPTYSRLVQTGANAAVRSFPPTYSQSSRITLISGAPPETNTAPPVDLPVEALSLVEVDTIFAQAHQAQLNTALLGTADWQRLIPRNHLDDTFFINAAGPEADQMIVDAALTVLKTTPPDLMLIHLTQLDVAAASQGGTAGNAYRQAAARVDAHLDRISRAVDFNRQVLLIVSDHGHIAGGGHGGDEVEVIWQPLIMLGAAITPGNYSDVDQTDIAPTVTTLLGLAQPGAAQGRILFEMLRLSNKNRTIAQLMLSQQRVELAQTYLTQIAPSSAAPETLIADLNQAGNTLTQNNIDGAFQLARLTQQQADTLMTTARHNRLRAEQWPRLLVALLALSILTITLWRRRGAYAGLIIVAAGITLGLYHILYQIQGYSYSISSLNNLADLPFDITRRTAVSLLAGGGLMLVVLMLSNEKDWASLLGAGYGFSVLVTFAFGLPLFWAFWQNGFVISWHLPPVGSLFWQITSLHEARAAAILGLILPWPIMLLNLLVNRARRYLDESQPKPEPDALPGLHL